MAKCQGTTKGGSPCSRNATTGDYCKTHSNSQDVKSASPTRDPNLSPPQEFVTIFDKAIVRMDDADIPPGVQVQWARLAADCIRLTKEERRLLDGHGDGVSHTFSLVYPAGNRPLPPEDETSPQRASEGDTGDTETVH